MTKNYKYVLQENTYDCGIACLQTIFMNRNKYLKRNNLNSLINKNNKGISMYDLIKESKKNGLGALGIKANLKDLTKEHLPCIAHTIKDKNYFHYIVILEINKQKILIMDPDEGIKEIAIKDFEEQSTGIYMIFENKKFKKSSDIRFKNLIKTIIKENKKLIFKCILSSIMYSIISLIFNYYLVIILSIYQTSLKLTYIISFIFINIILIKTFVQYIKNKMIMQINIRIDEKTIPQVISHILHLPYDYFIEQSTGEIATIISDIENFKDIVSKVFITSTLDILFIIIIIIYTSFINIIYTFVFIILGIILYFITKKFQNTFHNSYLSLKQSKIKSSSYIYDILTSYNTIKNLNIEDKVLNKTKIIYQDVINKDKNHTKKYYKYDLINNLVIDLSYIILILSSILFYIKTNQNTINIVLLSNIFYLSVGFISNITENISMKNIYQTSVNKVLDVLDLETEKFNKNNFETINKISFQQVDYIKNDTQILKNVSFEINKKDKVFIKGESGIGKSTLIRLLLKYHQPTSGKIKIDNISIDDLDLSFIRNQITYTSQNETLFQTSILENMKIVEENEEQIKKSCDTVLIKEIFKSDNYLDFILEENGNNLSGGQRKKLIIARSLLKAKNILVLDECFNEISIKEEEKILKNIFKNYPHLTVVLISHRNSNIKLFNKIIQIKKEEE